MMTMMILIKEKKKESNSKKLKFFRRGENVIMKTDIDLLIDK